MLQKTRQIAGLQPLANATRTRSNSATFKISNVRGHPSSSGGGPQPLNAFNCCLSYGRHSFAQNQLAALSILNRRLSRTLLEIPVEF